ncbi:hypothetical protein CBS101457_001038 [Exobasidium rhododendri]|nr:hypothetical protein CBS101457_001038 [Exobasidium rhododendri]
MDHSSRKRPAPAAQDDHCRRIFRNELNGQSAWDRHRTYVSRYLKVYEKDGGKARQARLDAKNRNDWDVLKERHQFLREDDQEGYRHAGSSGESGYEDEVAKRYYRHLFKEYAIADTKHYKSGNLALRWRSEDDVVDGIGQFTCANTRCEHHRQLQSSSTKLTPYEVNFAYQEPSRKGDEIGTEATLESKSALVKIVLCPRCARKLKYKGEKEKMSRPDISPRRQDKS